MSSTKLVTLFNTFFISLHQKIVTDVPAKFLKEWQHVALKDLPVW